MITIKKGDTLAFIVRRRDKDNNPLTGDANKLYSQLRNNKDILVADMVITETDVPGDYLFQISSEITKGFDVGQYVFDIEYRDGNLVKSSETFQVNVIKDVTRNV